MTKTGTTAAGRNNVSVFGSWPALLLVLLVLLASIYAFSPRPIPLFPVTQVHPSDLLINGLAQSGKRLVAVGEQGHILIADQVEGPWSEALVEPQRGSTLTQVLFVNDSVALAVGHDGWIVRSEDQAKTWKEVAFDSERSEPLLGVAGPYDGKLFAVGGFGQYLTSSDSGKTWNRETHAALADKHLNAIARASDGSLFLVGERGLMAHSTDNGQNWTVLPSIYTGSFFGMLSLPSKSLLAYGMRGNVFVSKDLGKTWKKSAIPEVISLFGGTVTASGDVILVGASNAVFVSKDDGAHFTKLTHEGRYGLAAVIPEGKDQWLTGGEGGISLKTASPQGSAATGAIP